MLRYGLWFCYLKCCFDLVHYYICFEDDELYIAGALVIKYDNRITIQISGYDKTYKRFVPNYFLYFAILDYYKDKLNVSLSIGEGTKENPYRIEL